jgi:hypothetical protein
MVLYLHTMCWIWKKSNICGRSDIGNGLGTCGYQIYHEGILIAAMGANWRMYSLSYDQRPHVERTMTMKEESCVKKSKGGKPRGSHPTKDCRKIRGERRNISVETQRNIYIRRSYA